MSKQKSWKKHHTAAAPKAWTLEARLMFDAAAASDLVHQLDATNDTHLADLQARETHVAAPVEAEPAPVVAAPELLFIDRDVADLDTLIAGTRAGIEVVLLDAGEDPWTQIGSALAARPGTSAVHLVSHGNQGELILGAQAYTAADLQARADQIGAWRDWLSADADILLYGCDVAAGGQGRALVDALAQLSGADVAASNDATGGAAQSGADWALEVQHGVITTGHFLDDASATGYQHRLATVALNGTAGWVPVMFGASRDPQGDSQAGAADTDIIGDATHGSLYTAFSDGGTSTTADDQLYFRLRIDNPTSASNFSGVAVVGMDVNSDGRVDLFMSVDGRNNGQFVRLLDPGTGANNSPNTTSTAPLPTGWLSNNGVYAFSSSNYAVTAVSASSDPNWGASATGMTGGSADNLTGLGGTDIFVSWRLPVVDLAAVLAKASPVDRNGVHGPRGASGIAGYDQDTTVSYVSFTQTQNGPINGDLNGVGASYDKNATFAQLGVYTAPMSAANPVSASTGLSITDNVAGIARSAQDVTFTFAFTENVTGFDASDISVANGTAGTFTAVDGRTYTLLVTPTQGSAGGDVTVSVAAAAATGASGLPTLAGAARQAYDTLAPSVTVDTPALALSGRPTLTGTTDLPDGALVSVTLDPDHSALTLDSVVYQALVSGGVWSLNTATAVPTSGRLPSAGLNASSQVTATATDAAGNASSAVELNRPTVNALSTASTLPTLSGRWSNQAGDTLSVSVNGATYILAPSGDTWSLDLASATPTSGSLGALLAGQTHAVTATVTRGADSAVDTTSGELVITSVPVIGVGIDGGDAVSGSNTRPTLSGTSTGAGGFVIVRLDPGDDGELSDAVTYSVTPDGAGNWSLDTSSATPISGQVPTGGFVGTIGVRATDSSGAVVDSQVLTISTPTLAIGSIETTIAAGDATASKITGDGVLNRLEAGQVTISGSTSAANGSTVLLVIRDASNNEVTSTATVSAGSWSATGLDLSGLNNGSLSVQATLADAGIQATGSVNHDKTPPRIFDTGALLVSRQNAVISGTSELLGQSVTVSVYHSTSGVLLGSGTATTNAITGAWSVALPSSLGNAATTGPDARVVVTSTGTDAAGNVAQSSTRTHTLGNGQGGTGTMTIATIAGDDVITSAEIAGGLTLSGTTSYTSALPAAYSIVVTDANGTSVTVPSGSITASAGNWTATLTQAQLQTLANGQLTVSARVTSGADEGIALRLPQLRYDTPTLAITDDAAGTATGDVTFTFTFSEDVTGFTAGDITLSAGTAGSFTAVDARTYTLVVTPPAGSAGSLTASVAHAVAFSSLTARGNLGDSDAQPYETTGAAAAPTIIIDADGLANSATPVISGTTSLAAGAPIVITLDPDNDVATADSLSYAATVQSGGTWSVDLASATPTSGSLPAAGLASYAKVSATATNAYGNSTTVVAHDAPAVVASESNDSTPTVSGTWTALAGDTLTVSVDGVAYTPTISGNFWSVDVTGALADGIHQVVATTTRGATAKADITTGELVIDTTATVDITGAATVGPVNTPTPVIAGTTTGLPAGTVLSLELDADADGTYELLYQTTLAADGSWSVDTASAIPVSGSLPADGLYGDTAMRASASDAIGNTGSDTQTLQVDVSEPAIAWTSGSRSASSLPLISGTTDLPAGSTVTLEIDPNNDGDWSDLQSYSATVQADGSWSVQTTLALSGTVGTRAGGSDAAGNAVLISRALTLDTSTPTIDVDAVLTANGDGIADASEDDAITLAGSTTQLADGSVVSVTITDGAITIGDTARVTAGRWSLSPLNLSGMASGTIRVTATALDASGDGYSASTRFEHDRSAVIAIDAIGLDTGALADHVTTDTDVTISGTATPGASVAVVVKDSGNVTVASFSVSAAAGTGAWTTAQTGTLATGSYTIEATVGATTVSQVMRIVSVPTLVSSSPADDATGIAVSTNLSLTFDHAVRAGSGHIVLNAANGSPVETFDVRTGLGDNGGSLSFDGSTGLSLNPGVDLTASSSYSLTIAATAVVDADGMGYAGIADATTLNFTTAGSNSAPVQTVPAAQSVDEDTALDFRAANGNAISVADAQDNLATTSLGVSHGSLSVSLSGGASISAGANGSAALTLAGSTAQINAALATLSYQGNADFNGSDTLTLLSTDSAGTPLTDSDTVAITVTAVNDTPVAVAASGTTDENTVLNGVLPSGSDVDAPAEIQETGAVDHTVANRTFSFFGDGSAEYGVAIGSGPTGFASIGDMAAAFQAHPAYADLPYTISVNAAGDGLRLTFKRAGNFDNRMIERWGDSGVPLTTVLDGENLVYALSTALPVGKGTLTLNANGGYTFDPGSDFDTLAEGQSEAVTFQYTVTDPAGQASAPQTVTITVIGTNDAPVLASTATLAFTENQSAAAIAPDLTISDADSASLTGATATVSSGYAIGQDALGYVDQNGITGSFDAGTGVLTLSGTATVAQYQAALRSVTYGNASDAPSTTSRTVTFQVDDGATLNHASNTVDVALTVAAVNDAPVVSQTVLIDTSVVLAGEGGLITAPPGTLIAYGRSGFDRWAFQTVDGSGQLAITNDVFGDPLPGVPKVAYLATSPVAVASETTVTERLDGAADENTGLIEQDGVVRWTDADLADVHTVALDGVVRDGSGSAIATPLGQLVLGTPDATDRSVSWAFQVDASVLDGLGAGESLTQVYTLSVDDGQGAGTTHPITIVLTGRNDAPVLDLQASTLVEKSAAAGDVAATYTSSDADGQALTHDFALGANVDGHYLLGTSADAGKVLLTAAGAAHVNAGGTLASVTLVASDGTAETPASITPVVTLVNDAPDGTDAALTVLASGSRDFIAADFGMVDAESGGNLAALRIDSLPAAGSLTLLGTPVSAGQVIASADLAGLFYTPAIGASDGSSASFTFSVRDPDGAFDLAPNTMTLNISATNTAPTAAADVATTDEDTPVTIDVLANDGDVEGSPLSIASATVPVEQGTVSIVNGQLVFTPAAHYSGTATITYVAHDGSADSAPATVTVTVLAVNDAPSAAADVATTDEDTPVTIDVLANDGDVEGSPLSIASATVPVEQGTVSIVNGQLVFTPAAHYSGMATITYVAHDGSADSAPATVTVTVLAVNDAPSWPDGAQVAAAIATDQDTAVSGTVPSASDVEAGTLVYAKGSDPAHGTVTVDEAGHYVYTPAAGHVGSDTFTVEVRDAQGGVATLTITVTVRAVTPVPTPDPEPEPEPDPDPVVDPVVDPVIPTPATPPVVAAPASAAALELPAPDAAPASTVSFDSTLRSDASPLAVTPTGSPAPVEATAPAATASRSTVDGDIYTRPSGFQIMVSPSTEPALKLYRGIDDQIVPMSRVLIVQVPADAFVHTVLNETVTLTATQADGRPLPAWLSFDGRTGKLVGEPPVGQMQDLAIKVTARDSQGREASAMFRIKVSDTTLQRQTSRASFSQQLARGEALTLSPGQRQWHLQGRALPLRRG